MCWPIVNQLCISEARGKKKKKKKYEFTLLLKTINHDESINSCYLPYTGV